MCYAMVAILADPDHADVVRKMREELDANLGEEPLRLNNKHKTPYCEAVTTYFALSDKCIEDVGLPYPVGFWHLLDRHTLWQKS